MKHPTSDPIPMLMLFVNLPLFGWEISEKKVEANQTRSRIKHLSKILHWKPRFGMTFFYWNSITTYFSDIMPFKI